MKFGISASTIGLFADPALHIRMAIAAENAGWDGYFLWDHLVYEDQPVIDTWTTLAAIAVSTGRLSLGPMVSPLPRYPVAQLARHALTVAELSGGRLILGLGLGYGPDEQYGQFGQPNGSRQLREIYEEGLYVLRDLLTGKAVDHAGDHLTVRTEAFQPQPSQPIPVWLGASNWPNRSKPVERAAAWHGVFPEGFLEPQQVSAIRQQISDRIHGPANFDVVIAAHLPESTKEATAQIHALGRAGATWLMALGVGPWFDDVDLALDIISNGPPDY